MRRLLPILAVLVLAVTVVEAGLSKRSARRGRVASPAPCFELYDSDTADSDVVGKVCSECTDTGSGTEDCDLILYQAIAGTLTEVARFDADNGASASQVLVGAAGGTSSSVTASGVPFVITQETTSSELGICAPNKWHSWVKDEKFRQCEDGFEYNAREFVFCQNYVLDGTDDLPFMTDPRGNAGFGITLLSAQCTCSGTCTTEADLTFEHVELGTGGPTINAVTGTVQCNKVTDAPSFQALSGDTAVDQGDLVRFDVGTTPNPTTDTYTVCVKYSHP